MATMNYTKSKNGIAYTYTVNYAVEVDLGSTVSYRFSSLIGGVTVGGSTAQTTASQPSNSDLSNKFDRYIDNDITDQEEAAAEAARVAAAERSSRAEQQKHRRSRPFNSLAAEAETARLAAEASAAKATQDASDEAARQKVIADALRAEEAKKKADEAAVIAAEAKKKAEEVKAKAAEAKKKAEMDKKKKKKSNKDRLKKFAKKTLLSVATAGGSAIDKGLRTFQKIKPSRRIGKALLDKRITRSMDRLHGMSAEQLAAKGYVRVPGFTRSDGVKVKSHIRKLNKRR